MAKTDGKPVDDSFAGSFDDLKRNLLAWLSAESAVLRACMNSSARRMAFAAAMIFFAMMAIFIALTILAGALVQFLAASFGPVTAGLMVGVGLLLLALLLLVAAKSILSGTDPLAGRLRSNAKFIWSQFHDKA